MKSISALLLATAFCIAACSKPVTESAELKQYPLDSLEGVITRSDVELDKAVSSDGKGSLKVTASGPTIVKLFETGDVDIEDARLIYRAKVRTQNVEGKAFLEMWCSFPGKGEFFSRGIQAPLSGTQEWTTVDPSS